MIFLYHIACVACFCTGALAARLAWKWRMDYLFREAADDLSVTCRQNVQALLAGVIGVVNFFAASVSAGLAAAPGAIRIVAYLGIGVSICPFINASIDMIAAGFGNISKRFRGRA